MNFYLKSFVELTTTELYEILRVREEIFMMELGMHCRDLDGVDLLATHCFLMQDGSILAYLRAFPEQEDPAAIHIGRVLTCTHGKGHGRALMTQAISALAEKFSCKRIVAHAQVQAAPFYEKLGFSIVSEPYLEEGVPHVSIERTLP